MCMKLMCSQNQNEVEVVRDELRKAGIATEMNQARSLFEKALQGLFQRESELTAECASLRKKVDELTQALARENESHRVAESNQEQQMSALVKTLESERQTWQEQLADRDEFVKRTQMKLEAISRLLEAQREAVGPLREEIVSLELQQEDYKKFLCAAREESLAERDARVAAEERADKATQARKSLEAQLLHCRSLEHQMQGYVASLNSLWGRTETTQR